MSPAFAFFKFVTKAALSCVGLGVAGDFFGEFLPDLADEVYRRWAEGRSPKQLSAAVQALAAVSDEEARRLALAAVKEEAADQAESIQLALLTYLTQIPSAARQTRLADGGALALISRPADVMPLLPPRLPRFKKGQGAPGFPDWELDALLGMGGFGEVWKATNPHLPPVALKFCLDPSTARTLRHEAELLGRIVNQGRHPGIVALLDTALSNDPPCLKYEYVPGGDLTGLIRQWHRGPAQDIVPAAQTVVRELAATLAFAHGLHPPIVHRDLKPANVLLGVGQAFQPDSSAVRLESPTYTLKIADFGIGAIVAGQAVEALSLASTRGMFLPTVLRGSCTPLYASPQQMRGEEPDPRDDVFALGVIWFQMLTGQLTERPGADWREDLAGLDLPPAMLDVLGHCLAVKAERRHRDAAALLAALDDMARPRPSPPAPDPEPEPEEADPDDPAGLAAHLQRSLQRAQQTIARVVELTEKKQDYAGAARLLEGLPEAFRDQSLLEVVCERAARVEELRKGILADARAYRFAGLRDRIEELLELTPQDAEMRRLRQAVPWEPGAEVTNSVSMKLVLIRPGPFWMGAGAEAGAQECEGPSHEVEISQRFHLGAYPVTQEQYQRVMGANPSHFRSLFGHDTRQFPVENVSWDEAAEFCRRLSALEAEKRRGRSYRLPTEAEWEYACRAGAKGLPFHVGRSLSSTQANFDGRHPYGDGRRGDFLHRTTAVGLYAPNAWGLCDMHGNVWEWCSDWFDERYYRCSLKRDPAGPARGTARVLRGGSWQNHARLCRSASRDWVSPGFHGLNIGFRVVLVVTG